MGASPDDSGVAIGTVLAGRYRIDGVLGSGGMGRVYHGQHTSIGKAVAVKVLHAALGKNTEAAARFQREAMASGRLDHPNIVGVMDFGVLDDGCLYLVMEALEGEHLGKRLQREKQIAWQEALLITRSILFGLRHAHDRGVVHRDIKPDNIFLANKDGDHVVKILDFGIAKLYAGNTDDPTATRAGITVGTPTYLAPEQAVGGAITPACDLYSTSVVLYEMLVGHAPFEDLDPVALLRAHVSLDPPPFLEVAPELDLPESLEPLIRHGMQKIAVERIASAMEYVQRIDEILTSNGVPLPASPLSARSSQSMGIPPGPYAQATPQPGSLSRTPGGLFTPSPGFMSTPMPYAATAVAPTPIKPKPTVAAAPRPLAKRIERRWLVTAGAGIAAAGVIIAAILFFGRSTSHPPSPPPPAAPPSPRAPAAIAAPATTPPAPTPPATAPNNRDARLKESIRELETGATCAERKKAITRLLDIHDAKAIPALKKARYRRHGGTSKLRNANDNACLLPAANAAIKSLSAGN